LPSGLRQAILNSNDKQPTHETINRLMTTLRFTPHIDPRGSLLPLDFRALPLDPKRVFLITKVPPGTVRGGHGPGTGKQLLVATGGPVQIVVQRGSGQRDYVDLCSAGEACLLETGDVAWIRYCAAESALLVLSDTPYDPMGYVYSDAVPTNLEWHESFP